MALLTPDVEPLWIARYDYEAGWQLPPHAHEDYFQMILIASGAGEATIGSETLRFQTGHLLFLRPGLLHGLVADAKSKVCTVDTKFRVKHRELHRACNKIAASHTVVDARIPALFEAIHAEAKRHHALSKEHCQMFLQQILLIILKAEDAPVPFGPPTVLHGVSDLELDLCGRMERFLRENCAKEINQATLSEAMAYSYRHLHTCWRKRHRDSPLQALWHYRVERAMQLIRYSDYELKRIAELTGFASIHHFTRVFTRVAQISPARWRERERTGIRQDIAIRPGFVNPTLTIQSSQAGRLLRKS
jgi:AraC-like DNA-binding protein